MGCEGIRGRTGARAVGTSYPHIHRLVHPLPGPHPRYRRLISTRRGGLTTNGIHATLPASLSNGSGPPHWPGPPLSAWMRSPCASTSPLQMTSPRPAPPFACRPPRPATPAYLRNRWGSRSGATPRGHGCDSGHSDGSSGVRSVDHDRWYLCEYRNDRLGESPVRMRSCIMTKPDYRLRGTVLSLLA